MTAAEGISTAGAANFEESSKSDRIFRFGFASPISQTFQFRSAPTLSREMARK
jgi:hypothetical protein